MGIQERKEREREARREEILDAAEAIFFKKGLVDSTIDEIAEKAELSKGTIYLYYKSKEDLYVSVAYRGMEVLYGIFEKTVSSGEPVIKRLASLGEGYLSFFKGHRQYFRMMNFFDIPSLVAQVTPEVQEKCFQTDRRLWDLVVGVIREGIEQGLLHRDLDPLEVGVMLWSNSNGLMRLMDRTSAYWSEVMHLDLEKMIGKSNALLVEGMMTDRAKELYPPFTMFYHRTDHEPPQSGGSRGGATT